MKLYIKEQMVLPVTGSLRLRKTQREAAATLTATLYLAPADQYFLELSVAVGDSVRLLDREGKEIFLGSVFELQRTPETVSLTAYDRGIFLTRNELRGVFCGTPAQIVGQVAAKLEIPLGTVETEADWKCIAARSGQSAFSILRQAAGNGREISIRNGALCVTKSPYMVYALDPSQVAEANGSVDLSGMVNRCTVVDRKGTVLAASENAADLARYGCFQRVLTTTGGLFPSAQANAALKGSEKTGEITVAGHLNYLCGCAVELHRKDWGLDGVYCVTAAEHRWEKGIYTTTMELEFVR